uniref:Uncharacterized protein n=1 Tax=Solanum lycopersicum TaxID=4081 RepID=A0A3Q7GM32_SOLLC
MTCIRWCKPKLVFAFSSLGMCLQRSRDSVTAFARSRPRLKRVRLWPLLSQGLHRIRRP